MLNVTQTKSWQTMIHGSNLPYHLFSYRMVFIILNEWETHVKDEYFMTFDHDMKHKFQYTQSFIGAQLHLFTYLCIVCGYFTVIEW